MKEFKKPDLNAPRFRPKKLNVLKADFYKRFLDKYPRYKGYSNKVIKEVIYNYNEKIWKQAVDHRDGVELPEQLGYLFIGSCPRKTGENTDYKQSINYGVKIQNQNWESDQYTAKIFYTNFESKYRFRFHELWGFTGIRDFKRTVGATYPLEWKKYILIDNLQRVSRLFRKQKYKTFVQEETLKELKYYNEFDLD